MKKGLLLVSALLINTFNSPTVLAAILEKDTHYEVCFTPGQACTQLITNTIDKAKTSLFIQAYSFTSADIAKAILAAKRRGVKVTVLLDKSQVKNNRYSSSQFLQNNNIDVLVDYKPAIAHNKVMLIDKMILITGSFNFTQAAQKKNAENVLIIENANLANKYLTNWQNRFVESASVKSYLEMKSHKKGIYRV